MKADAFAKLGLVLTLVLLPFAAAHADETIGDNSVYQFNGEPISDVALDKTFLTWLGKEGHIFAREYVPA